MGKACSAAFRILFAALLLVGGMDLGAAAQPPQALIHPGDQLSVQVFGDQTLTQNTVVLQDGSLDYPLAGRVVVAGKTPTQAAGLIARRLTRYLRNPIVTIAVTQLAQPSVLVLGDVKNPGKYQLRSDGRISDAIAAAGGVVDINGEYPQARISDPSGSIEQISLQRLFHGGETTLDRRLSEGTVVYVPGPVQFNITVAGAVDHPGTLSVNEGDRVSIAIAKAGTSAGENSDLNHVRLIRTDSGGVRNTTDINLYQALQDGDQIVDRPLQKGDIVYVPQAKRKSDFSSLLYILTRLVIP